MKRRLAYAAGLAMIFAIALPISAFKPAIHADITKGVLTAISKTVGSNTYQFTDKAIQEIIKANTDTDCISCQNHSEYHFDDEDFTNASQRLVDLKKQILNDLSGSSPNGAKARQHLGTALHTVQDFYAHSTRVELGQSGFDNLLGVSAFSGLVKSAQTCGNDHATLAVGGLTTITSGYFPLPDPCTTLTTFPTGKCLHGACGFPLCRHK